MTIFHQPTLNPDVHKSTFIHSGMFTISCAMQWMQNFCSTPAPAHFLKSTCLYPRMIWTLQNCLFLIFVPVNLAKMEFLRGRLLMKVKQNVVLHLPLLLIDFFSSEVPEYRAGRRGVGSGMALWKVLIQALTSL